MSDRVVRVEQAQGFFGKLKESMKNVAIGFLLFLAAFPLVFWNECNSVDVAESLDEGLGLVVSVDSAAVDGAMEGKLVHTSGEATTDEVLYDDVLGVRVAGLRLKRSVEMYQWKETKSSRKEGEKKITTFDYSKDWSSSVINSSKFEEPSGHTNPSGMAIEDNVVNAENVALGAFALTVKQIDRLSKWTPVAPVAEDAARVGLTVQGGAYYRSVAAAAAPKPGTQLTLGLAEDPTPKPAVGGALIGDLRIKASMVGPGPVSIVAQQKGNSFVPYATSNGRNVNLLKSEALGAPEMFAAAQAANAAMTWILRGIAFLLLFAGLRMFFGPFEVIADKIPLVGGLISGALGLFCLLGATVFWFGAVAAAWIVARPLLGILLAVVSIAALVGMVVLAKKYMAQREAAPEPS